MEANCYPAHTRRARMFLVLTVVMMVFMAAVQGNTDEVTVAGAPEGSLLCISKCGTCPATCAQPPPPTLTPQIPSPPPPPSKAHSSPPSPRAHAPPPPPPVQGGPSNPYYYFYTSEATREHSISGFLRLFPMILFFSLSMLLQQ